MGHYDCKSCDVTPYEEHSPDCERFGTKPPPTEGTDMNQIEKVARDVDLSPENLAFVVQALRNHADERQGKGWMVSAQNLRGAALYIEELVRQRPAIAAMPVQAEPVAKRWQLGDKVRKKRGSSWRGVVCGFYSTPHTPQGYCVDSAFEPGSVQVWPEAALEDWDGGSDAE